MTKPSRKHVVRLGRVFAALCLVALVSGCAGSYGGGGAMNPSGTDTSDRQNGGGGGSGGGGGGY
jgi:hypothetical protein